MAEAIPIGLKDCSAPRFGDLRLSCYGIEVRISDNTGSDVCRRLQETLPPEFGLADGSESEVVSCVVDAGPPVGTAESSKYCISCGGVARFAASTEEELLRWLHDHI